MLNYEKQQLIKEVKKLMHNKGLYYQTGTYRGLEYVSLTFSDLIGKERVTIKLQIEESNE
jgi:hypothetical protein